MTNDANPAFFSSGTTTVAATTTTTRSSGKGGRGTRTASLKAKAHQHHSHTSSSSVKQPGDSSMSARLSSSTLHSSPGGGDLSSPGMTTMTEGATGHNSYFPLNGRPGAFTMPSSSMLSGDKTFGVLATGGDSLTGDGDGNGAETYRDPSSYTGHTDLDNGQGPGEGGFSSSSYVSRSRRKGGTVSSSLRSSHQEKSKKLPGSSLYEHPSTSSGHQGNAGGEVNLRLFLDHAAGAATAASKAGLPDVPTPSLAMQLAERISGLSSPVIH